MNRDSVGVHGNVRFYRPSVRQKELLEVPTYRTITGGKRSIPVGLHSPSLG